MLFLGATQLNSSLLTVSVIAVLLPAAFHFTAGAQIQDPQEGREILSVSHGVGAGLFPTPYRFTSHPRSPFRAPSSYYSVRFPMFHCSPCKETYTSTYYLAVYFSYLFFQLSTHKALYEDSSSDVAKSTKYPSKKSLFTDAPTATTSVNSDPEAAVTHEQEKEEEEEEAPKLTVWMTVGLLVIVTVVSLLARCLATP